MIVALAGGVGAAKFLRGLVRVVPPEEVIVVVNTADDIRLHGLHISPDLDTITYTLAEAADPDRGWGLANETWNCLDAMSRYGLGTWFGLGDRDLATHLYRTAELAAGRGLASVTDSIARAWGIRSGVLPMTEDPVENRIVVSADGAGLDLHFQEYLIERGAADPVLRVYYKGVERARPLETAVEALRIAEGIVVCPSNPVVSIGPILAIDAYRRAIARRKVTAVGISPLVGGAPVRGPADKLMPAIGLPVTTAGVADAYAGLLDVLVTDTADAQDASAVAARGIQVEVTETLMTDRAAAMRLARTVVRMLGL